MQHGRRVTVACQRSSRGADGRSARRTVRAVSARDGARVPRPGPGHVRACGLQRVTSIPPDAGAIRERLDVLWRVESRRVLATLVRLLGDFHLAEDGLAAAFIAALEQWPRDGVPAHPRAWLIATGRHKSVEALRRRARFDRSLEEFVARLDTARDVRDSDEWDDDRLRLVFACCHPLLPVEAQIALTLCEVGGLTTEEVARALLVGAPTVAQRIVRAKARLREARVEYRVPSRAELPARLGIVLHVLYLIFNEGYLATSGADLVRVDLSNEAIRLARLVQESCPEPEAQGLLALMLLHDARRAARTNAAGDLVLIEDQDRTKWNRAQILEGGRLIEQAIASRRFGAFTLQAAIAAVHAEARDAQSTDWEEIVALYDLLLVAAPTPITELNRAMAVAERDGAASGLALVDGLLARGELATYHLAHAARADLCRRLGRTAEARDSYRRALEFVHQESERRFLGRRIGELGG
ncbi:MAG: RNA polymerase sigma factor [Planctomycetes bacterium]|nr:RNA polymerase sigma factor [Planctomycetota bacterium]